MKITTKVNIKNPWIKIQTSDYYVDAEIIDGCISPKTISKHTIKGAELWNYISNSYDFFSNKNFMPTPSEMIEAIESDVILYFKKELQY